VDHEQSQPVVWLSVWTEGQAKTDSRMLRESAAHTIDDRDS
jgi:hypothetical protein